MRAKANHDSVDAVQSSGMAYRKARAEYKKLLLTTKRKAWEFYCLNYNDRFGTLFNIVFNKFNSNHSIAVNPNNDPNLTVQDKISYIMEYFFPGQSPEESLNYTPTIGPVEPLIIDDLETVFGNLKGAELAAIQHAANWAASNNHKINVFTDSLSSIMALKSAHSRSQFVNTAKQILFTAKDLVGLSWVKAHVGIPGNEWADQQAKLAISVGEELEIPRSYLNRKIKSYILHNWLNYWNNYNLASGTRKTRRAYWKACGRLLFEENQESLAGKPECHCCLGRRAATAVWKESRHCCVGRRDLQENLRATSLLKA
ncbi:hypothetical protein AVEN_27081-1 [Araneus ventricosus]|uniref:RNase H type-1 domain-containing protein n=1 Tax=Araneus ventricosus TaxID=182803 RepID=A0A4Y2K7R6_ARAVE|nr:hypothetical protein AVEN_27081-1 [Araneus ventricosus]